MSGGNGGKLNNQAILGFIKSALPGKKLADGGGLYLLILPSGNPSWQIKYRLEGKEKSYSIGQYPTVTLAAARAERLELKLLIKEGKDPVANRRVNRAINISSGENTFKTISAEWLTKKKPEWSEGHYIKSARALERDVYPFLGNLFYKAVKMMKLAVIINDDSTNSACTNRKFFV